MRTWTVGLWAALSVGLMACDGDGGIIIVIDDDIPAAPRSVDAQYFNQSVIVTWELAPAWDGEPFRVYSRRESDQDFFLIAEVTSCAFDECEYIDLNVTAGITYLYFVSAVNPDNGVESDTETIISVFVPSPIPPAVPNGIEVIALDGSNFIRWSSNARTADDFSHYRVYQEDGSNVFLLGETDSEGFLDQLASNGNTFAYFVTSVDDQGHESAGSFAASGTPRPDFHGEVVWAFEDVPDLSGFRFQDSELIDPVLAGSDNTRTFRLEVDNFGWWFVLGSDAEVFPQAFETSALKCGVAADVGCTSLDVAPTSGYQGADLFIDPGLTYVFRVGEVDGFHYGALRVEMLGFDQNGDALMIFDWAYQLQPGNANLAPVSATVRIR